MDWSMLGVDLSVAAFALACGLHTASRLWRVRMHNRGRI